MRKSPFVVLAFILLFATVANGQIIPTLLQRSLSSPAIAGSGNLIVFSSSYANSAYVQDVFSVNADGSNLRQLTKLPTSAPGVTVTADGRWAAYTAGQSGNSEEVHLLSLSTGADRTLVDKQGCFVPQGVGAMFTCLNEPHITDDGSAILYTMASSDHPFYVVKTDGSPPVNLPMSIVGVLTASPKRVISLAGQVVFSTIYPGPGQVHLMNLDGTNIRTLINLDSPGGPGAPFNTTISADGSRIAFTNSSGKTFLQSLYTMRSDGSQLSLSAYGHVSSPSLRADGSVLAYIDSGQVAVLALGGTSTRKLLTNFQYSSVKDATISDDGTRIAFTIGPLSYGGGAIYSIKSDGTNMQAAYSPRTINPNGVAGAVAGSLVSVYGTSLANDSLITADSLPLPKSLGGVSLEINGATVPLLAVSPWQINAQVPPDLPPSTTTTFDAAFSDGSRTATIQANVALVLPSVYLLANGAVTGPQAAVFHGNTPIPTDSAHPATAGEALVLYASGLGPTNLTVPAGIAPPANPPATTSITPEVSVGGKPAQLLFSGLAPGFVGVYQINFLLPAGLPAGTQSISITSAGQSGVRGVISVQ
jgi:uncharacterized protein (TIGR03437 family)